MYRATTHEIEITVEPFYLEEQSEPDEGRYFWGYRVTIANLSKMSVCLRSRYWKITDATGKIEEVNGPGVVGEQPVIQPGDSYQYSSGCPLKTNSGMMIGSYHMQSANGEAFEVNIPGFSLDLPDSRRTLN
ncbi:Co2+/Mg2+ efflux protein ApaG [Brucellaceae bacterium C25G]